MTNANLVRRSSRDWMRPRPSLPRFWVSTNLFLIGWLKVVKVSNSVQAEGASLLIVWYYCSDESLGRWWWLEDTWPQLSSNSSGVLKSNPRLLHACVTEKHQGSGTDAISISSKVSSRFLLVCYYFVYLNFAISARSKTIGSYVDVFSGSYFNFLPQLLLRNTAPSNYIRTSSLLSKLERSRGKHCRVSKPLVLWRHGWMRVSPPSFPGASSSVSSQHMYLNSSIYRAPSCVFERSHQSLLVLTLWKEPNLDIITSFSQHPGDFYVLLHRFPVLYSLECLH